MEHIKPILERRFDNLVKKNKKKSIIGNDIKCKFCKQEAKIMLQDSRYKVYCPTCQNEYYLCEQHLS